MKTILFPTDFSACADNAFHYTLGLCDKLKADLVLFNSFHIPAYATNVLIYADADNIEEQKEDLAEKGLIRMKNKALSEIKNCSVECIVNYGLAVDNIISIADEKNADLIIMGTKGASGLQEVFAGSNTFSVLEKSNRPVLIIPENVKFKKIEKIVFATNFNDTDFQSIAFLSQIASLFNSEILIAHVVQVTPTKDYESDLLQWFKEELKNRANVEYKNISFHVLTGGNVGYELEDFIEKNNVDLLSLSMRKRTLFAKLFDRSLTKKFAYHTHTPLLAFHASMGLN